MLGNELPGNSGDHLPELIGVKTLYPGGEDPLMNADPPLVEQNDQFLVGCVT